jgi:NAD(P)-dependent dehydrogenase (short-subunit alcohol dehydrogenase family)
MNTVLITGSNRGIGLEFVKQFSRQGWQVIACCRQPDSAAELQSLASGLSNVDVHPLDVSREDSIQALSKKLANTPIDLLLNNAGVYATGANQFGDIDKSIWLNAIEINTIGPLLMAQAFMPQLQLGEMKKIATISSKVGSIDDNQSGSGYAYRSSKSALNQVMKSLSIDLASQGIKTVTLHPGWVLTDMGGPNALIDTETSVSGMMQVIDKLTVEQSGSFINYDGSVIPW